MNSGCAAALDGLQDFCFMAAKAANREPCPPPLPTLDFAPAFEVYTELGIDPNSFSFVYHTRNCLFYIMNLIQYLPFLFFTKETFQFINAGFDS